MFNNSSKMMFMMIVVSGSFIAVSSNSWLSAWMGLEINLLAFIPLMTASSNLMPSEAALKYFLTQALASSILLFSIIMTMMKQELVNELINTKYLSSMTLSALLLKSGAAPFHFWLPSVMEGLNWTNSLILMTWQKIAPLMLTSLIIMNSPMMIYTIILSATIGSLGGLNQTSLRKIMAFSSINHLGWMLASMSSSEPLWLTYFMLYTLLTFNVVMLLSSMKLIHINQLFSTMFTSKTLKFSMMMNLLSLGGLPPFLGFLPKWLVIQGMVNNSQMFLMALMTTMSLITLYFYLRMCYSALMMTYNEPSWMPSQPHNNTTNKMMMMLSFTSNFTLFSASLIFMMT